MGIAAIILATPLALVFSIFGSITTAIFGGNLTEVELPYNPEQGTVWKYDDKDDTLFDLKEVEVKGDKQVFIFEGITASFNSTIDAGAIEDVIFTDQNGNEFCILQM